MKQKFSQVSIASVGNEEITINDLIFHLKTDLGKNLLDSAIHERLLKRASDEMGVFVDENQLQRAADNFRRRKGLFSAKETFDWLDDNGLSIGEFERKLEKDLIRDEVISQVADETAIRRVFLENYADFQKVKVGIIVVEEESTANEIIDQLVSGDVDFTEMALKYSILKEAEQNGGFLGNVFRNELPYAVDEAVFDDDAPILVGPIPVGPHFYIANIYEKANTELDDVCREVCRRMLIDEFLREKSLDVGVDIYIFPEHQNINID